MTRRKIEEVTEETENSFEDILEVPSGTTEVTKKIVVSERVESELYDQKDYELDDDLRKLQDNALTMHESLVDEMEDAEPSKKARLAEVSGQMLSITLGALKERNKHKQHKDSLNQKDKALDKKGSSSGGRTTNNVFVGSQDDLLEFIRNNTDTSEDPNVIEGDFEEPD
jgi:hypothetical protein